MCWEPNSQVQEKPETDYSKMSQFLRIFCVIVLCLWYLHGYFLKTPLLDVLKDYFFNMENFLQTSSTIIHWRPMLAAEFTSFISSLAFLYHFSDGFVLYCKYGNLHLHYSLI